MNIILGLSLDSTTYPDSLEGKEAVFGTVVTGFQGLIGILETQLGLTMPPASENIRIAEWQELIRNQNNGKMLFSKSFETDPWNTAKELLRRRDELVLAGWNPAVHTGGSKWIRTLAQLELANPNKSKGFADRFRVLLETLQGQIQLHIDSITIVDEDQGLWDPWAIQLIKILESKGVLTHLNSTFFEKENAQPDQSSDLSMLKAALNKGEKSSRRAQGDGSILLVRSEQEWDAADFLISWLQENGTDHTVLIKGNGSLFLDQLLHRKGLPATGADVPSKWRAVLQVLGLTIDTHWAPLRVERMLELLTIPASPVPGKIRYKLSRELAKNPGIGGEEWMKIIEDGIKEYKESWEKEGLEERKINQKEKDLLAKLDLWIRHDFYDPIEGIPLNKLVDICQKVINWAKNNSFNDGQMFAHAVRQAQEVIEGVKTLGVEHVTQLQFRRILDSVLGQGEKLANHSQEASKWQVISAPGQIWGLADTIIWWGFHKNMSGPSTRTWTTVERNWLRDQGIQLPDESVRRQREAASWKRSALAANRRLILFAPSKVSGEEISIHPFWDEIRYAVAEDYSTVKKITIDASGLRQTNSYTLFEKQFDRAALNVRNIPEPQRTWVVPEKAILPREEESATSFESLIGCPLKWTFNYAANIKPGNILSLPNESLMLGKLGHSILEHLIKEKSTWESDEVRIRVGELFDQLTPIMAATMLEPQKSIDHKETRLKLQKSLQKFFEVLNNSGIKVDHSEKELEKKWSETVGFKGRLDLVGETSRGKKIFFDAKWSKSPKNYKEKLEKVSVQLALYHWLLAENEEDELPVAYFMLQSGDFFTLPNDDLPSDYHVNGPSLRSSFEVVRRSVEDVWEQIQKGTIIAPGVPAKESEEPFESKIDPPCGFCQYQNLCGFRRVGK